MWLFFLVKRTTFIYKNHSNFNQTLENLETFHFVRYCNYSIKLFNEHFNTNKICECNEQEKEVFLHQKHLHFK